MNYNIAINKKELDIKIAEYNVIKSKIELEKVKLKYSDCNNVATFYKNIAKLESLCKSYLRDISNLSNNITKNNQQYIK